MGQEPEFEENCERYLLGELSEAEQEQFEEAYFADDALFERFQAVKDEMLDAYARGQFPGEKRKRFDAHFLASAANRRELNETREFIRAVTAVSAKTTGDAAISAPAAATTQKSSRPSFKSFFNLRPFAWQAVFAIVLLLALAGVWFLIRGWQRTPINEEVAVQPTPLPTIAAPANENDNTAIANNAAITPSPTPAGLNKPPANISQPAVNVKTTPPRPTPEKPFNQPPRISPAQTAFAVLMPVTARDISASNTLRLDPDTRTVRLGLAFKSGRYRSYNASITTIEGANVWQRKNLKAANKSVTLQFASTLLRGQDYIVTLTGITPNGRTETVGEYYFRVERRPD